MRPLALLFALFTIVSGTVLGVAPDRMMAVGPYAIAPAGLYAIGALRVGMRLVLMAVATTSRAPGALPDRLRARWSRQRIWKRV